jgi:hypothetical protein
MLFGIWFYMQLCLSSFAETEHGGPWHRLSVDSECVAAYCAVTLGVLRTEAGGMRNIIQWSDFVESV